VEDGIESMEKRIGKMEKRIGKMEYRKWIGHSEMG
jgi:hypothetical protein